MRHTLRRRSVLVLISVTPACPLAPATPLVRGPVSEPTVRRILEITTKQAGIAMLPLVGVVAGYHEQRGPCAVRHRRGAEAAERVLVSFIILKHFDGYCRRQLNQRFVVWRWSTEVLADLNGRSPPGRSYAVPLADSVVSFAHVAR